MIDGKFAVSRRLCRRTTLCRRIRRRHPPCAGGFRGRRRAPTVAGYVDVNLAVLVECGHGAEFPPLGPLTMRAEKESDAPADGGGPRGRRYAEVDGPG